MRSTLVHLGLASLWAGLSLACDQSSMPPPRSHCPDACSDAGGVDGGAAQDGPGSPDGSTASDAGSCANAPLCVERHLDEPPTFDSCIYASPLVVSSQGEELLLVAPRDGAITALSTQSGERVFEIVLPHAADETTSVIATPALDGQGRAFVAYHTERGGVRLAQRVVVIDLEQRKLDAAFEPLTLSAEKPTHDGTGTVSFLASHSLARAALQFASTQASPDGFVYVSFGNARDVQPWHGWMFELDIAAWHAGGTGALRSVLLTTPGDECPVEGQSGSRDMICGGGIWSPTGPVIVADEAHDSYELLVPTGNGLLDFTRQHYANSLLRVGPGLAFDPGCDATACATFDPHSPADDCVSSCSNIFVPRLRTGDLPPAASEPECDGKPLLDCYAALDYDLGANTPAKVELADKALWVMPAKDGAVYLVDGEHLGTLHDREVLIPACGTADDRCSADWAGMMVTQPKIVQVNGEPLALIPTFVFDRTHPAGLVALAVVEGSEGPELVQRWQAPRFDSEEAHTRFRRHPSNVVTFEAAGRTYAAWVDVVGNGHGTLLVVDVANGEIVERVELTGRGRRFITPAVHERVLWMTSCNDNDGPGVVESFRF
jgi:hypothetical protein